MVEHALQAATRTNFRMRSFGAVLRYVDEALAELAALESKKSRQHAERRREAEKLLHRNYLDWKRSEIARLRANLPAAEADELGRAARDRVIREHGGQPPVGFETLVRIVVEEAISRSNSLPDFDTWKMQGGPSEYSPRACRAVERTQHGESEYNVFGSRARIHSGGLTTTRSAQYGRLRGDSHERSS